LIVITIEAGRLFAQPTGQQRVSLGAESAETFFVRGVNAQITFTKGPSGEVTALVLRQGGVEQTARKVR
jgi:hypothetical protein